MDLYEMENSSTTDNVGEAEAPPGGEATAPDAEQSSTRAETPASSAGVAQRRTRLAALRDRRAAGTSDEQHEGSEGDSDTPSRAGGLGIRDLAKPGAANDPIEAGRSVLARLTGRLNEDPSKSRTAFRSALATVQRGYEALDKEIARLQAELERAQEAMRTIREQGD